MDSQKDHKFTSHIKIVARGISDTCQRFCKLRVKGDMGVKTIVVRENHLGDYRDQLEAIGANLVSRKAFNELEDRIQAQGLKTPTLKVATRIEIRDDAMALPGGPYPKTDKFEVALTDVPLEIQQKYSTKGTLEDWKQGLAKLGRHNTRIKLAFALPFVGPLSAIMSVEHVGIQLVGEGGSGKSAIGVAASSVWGWDPNPVQADRNGFGQSWNSTVNNLERVFAGYNQTFLFANETRLAGKKPKEIAENVLETIMKIEGSTGKGRLVEAGTRRWFAPLLSTSNYSVQALAKEAGQECDSALLDRLVDIPPPADGFKMFEELHGFDDPAVFAVELKRFASENHGWPGREFIRKLLEAKAKDEPALKQFIKDRRAAYMRRAKHKIVSASRDLIRLHGKFATIYAAGALAIKYKVLPFTRDALRFAILKCEADHVAYVEEGGESKPQTSPLDKLRDQLREHRPSLINLADYDEKDHSAWGYHNRHDDGGEEVLLKKGLLDF
ncbi:MAG: DUF927 domain-containing protein [Steroidobacteraceae bacterium]